jgi:hypothetical protein
MTTTDVYLVSVADYFDIESWPISAIMPDAIDELLMLPPKVDPYTGDLQLGVYIPTELALRIPGVDAFWLVVSPGAGGTLVRFDVKMSPFGLTLRIPLILRVDTKILCPVDADDQPDRSQPTFDVTLGEIDLGLTADGHVEFDLGAASLPRCMVGTSGVIAEVGALKWVSPSTPAANLPPNTPAGFTGIFLDDVEVKISQLPAGLNALRLDDAFIGSTGFSGTISAPDLNLDWDPGAQSFTGAVHGELFGFQGGLSSVSIEFRQNALVGCAIAGDVFVPWVDKLIGLELGLTGDGDVSALARIPHSPGATGVTGGTGDHLLSINVYDVAEINVDSIGFDRASTGVARVEITGSVKVSIDGLELPEVGLKALRVDSNGKVDIDGGWMELPTGTSSPFNGFPLEISKVGFGSEDADDGSRMWVGLSGGIKLADGLPVGGSVEGLKISWRTQGTPDVRVSLSGVGIELDIPNVIRFSGKVAFIDDGVNQGFRGGGNLSLPTLGLGIDVNIVVGRNKITGETFFYFHLGVDLPVGIPLAQTGIGFYGFEGLVANNMGPDRRNGENWYWGWYVRDPRGATGQEKWAIRSGAFAAGLGTTLGTMPDTAYTFNASILLVLVLPGPVLMLEGKGSLLQEKPSGDTAGMFEALMVLDVPSKLFQVNLAITYSIEKLVTLHGGADLGFSWASPTPPHYWHVYLGEDQPIERRWQAELLSIFTANQYFMIEESGLRLGAWVGVDEDWSFGPVRVWLKAEFSGVGDISFKPQHLQGHMHLGGEAGVMAFGAKVILGASADFDVSGPTPWVIEFDVEAHIEIDLWLWSFEWSETVHLEWRDPVPAIPQPATPIVRRLAHQSLVADYAGDLDTATIPADSNQVVVFSRPVRDLAGIGAPGSATLAPDVVGPARFSYQLGHMALHRKRGNAWTVVAASGFVDVNAGAVAVPGLTLDGAAGSRLSLIGGQTYDVMAASAGTLSVTGGLPAGRTPYRLRGARPTATVQITAVAAIGAGYATVTVAADPGIARDALGGGTLTIGTSTYDIAGNDATTITVRTAATAPTLPPSGTATVVGPDGPVLEGAWMKNPTSNGGADGPKLMIGARTPFAQFHHNLDRSVFTRDIDPAYICGPEPVERPTCITFDGVPTGPLTHVPVTAATLQLTGSGEASIADLTAGTRTVRVVKLGDRAPGRKQNGQATVTFNGPVDRVWIRGTTDEQATVTAQLAGNTVDVETMRPGMRHVELQGPLDGITIDGTLVNIFEVCYVPDWTCIRFEAATFPQDSTGQQSYAGVTLDSGGAMRVDANDLLAVTAPRRGFELGGPIDDVRLRPLPFVDLPDHFGVHPLPPLDAPHQRQVVPAIPGLPDPSDVFLNGIGIVGARPQPPAPAPAPAPRRRGRSTIPSRVTDVTLRTDLRPAGPLVPAPGTALDRWLAGGLLALRSVASVTVYFPQPVTRVRVDVEGAANVTIAAGPKLVASGAAATGAPAMLDAAGGWVDRVAISALDTVRIREICTDAGDFGWQRFEQWAWRDSIRRSLSRFAGDAPVLAPGEYRFDVVTGWVDEARPGAAATWTTESARFSVGAPPGLRADVDGPINELATYVDATMPAAGERPFYRSYDIGVAFNRAYVSRMFLENATPLTLGVLDANGREIRPGTANVWGRGPELALTVEEVDWLSTLHSDGTEPCASIDTSSVSRNEQMHAGAGELLLPANLHTGVLGTTTTPLFTFDFVTSRYASFVHHLAHFTGVRAATTTTALDAAVLRAALAPAESRVVTARAAVAAASQAVSTGTPTFAQFDALATARQQLLDARDGLGTERRAAFAAAAAASGISPTRNRPPGVEVTVVDGAFLLESDEPLNWDRITLVAQSGTELPQRRDVIEFPEVEFGAPDAGSFVYRGRQWRTTAELWAKGDAVSARLPAPWTLTVELDAVTGVEVVVDVEAGGSVTLHGDGTGASPDVVATASGSNTLRVTAATLTGCSISGSGFSLRSLAVTAPWQPAPAAGGVRIVDVRLPANAADAGHFVEVMADDDVDLARWRLQWQPADASSDWRDYHVVALAGRALPAGATARVVGGAATGTAAPGRATWFGGLDGTFPTTGAVVRLVDPGGRVVHERAAMPAGTTVPCAVVPDGDLTRAYLLPAVRSKGWWVLTMNFARDLGLGEPVLSVGGDTAAETGSIGFPLR